MKALGDASFFHAFETIADAGNPGHHQKSWRHEGACWRRDRQSISCAEYTLIAEVFTVAHETRPKWTLLVVKEHWWAGEEKDAVRSQRWARPISGRRSDILAWFRARQNEAAQRP
ncbi:MAG: hypothetical protein GC153_03045 [Alphaproteobacteria bacterium]|nr:hypothetical protein [Alphaproteobacteria bacterium]